MTTAAIYLRQSLDRTGEGHAVERQQDECQRLADAKGWQVVAVYRDNDISASTGKVRPAYRQLLTDARAGAFDTIVVWHIDRLARRVLDLEEVIELGLPVATVAGDVDLSTDMGRLVVRLVGSVAQAEVERKGARQKAANRQAAAKGRPPSGPRAFGYESNGIVTREGEAELVRKAYSLLLAGGSLRSIATRWNEAGTTTAHGNSWRASQVRRVLQNPRYAGFRALNGDIQAPGCWEALVPEETWRAACSLLADERRRTTPTTARRYPLSGLARCFCGAHVDTGRTQHGVRTYKCSQSRHLSRAAEPIEELVDLVMQRRLGQPDLHDLLADVEHFDVPALRDEAAALRVRMDEAAEMFARGDLPAKQLATATKVATKRVEEIEGQLASLARQDVLAIYVAAKDPVLRWKQAELHERRAVLSDLLTITLHSPGRGARSLDPKTIEFTWRRGQG